MRSEYENKKSGENCVHMKLNLTKKNLSYCIYIFSMKVDFGNHLPVKQRRKLVYYKLNEQN